MKPVQPCGVGLLHGRLESDVEIEGMLAFDIWCLRTLFAGHCRRQENVRLQMRQIEYFPIIMEKKVLTDDQARTPFSRSEYQVIAIFPYLATLISGQTRTKALLKPASPQQTTQ